MNTPFFISWRYQRAKQRNRLVSLIAFFSTFGIAMGVAALILGLSAMNGFQRELNNRILAVVPHAEITSAEERPIADWQGLSQPLKSIPQIQAVSPFVSFTALVENGAKLKVVQVKGVEPPLLDQVSQLSNFVLDTGWQHFREQGGLILGHGIAKELDVNVGDWVTLLISSASSGDNQSQPSRERIQVSGILRLDGQLDHNYALIPLSQAQSYLGYEKSQVSGVEMKVADPFAMQNINYGALNHYPQMLSLTSWMGKFGYMYRDIQLIRTVMYIAMVLVIGVACFNIVSTLMMAVKDKAGDIAIMRTLGADNGFIKRIFMWYGLLAGMKGCVIGILLGVFLSLNLTALIQGVEGIIGRKLLSDGIYFVDFLPSELSWLDVLFVLVTALILSLIASLYPANRAARLEPAQVLSGH